ncbi:pantetheine-phosphate adenylyltransferase [Suttonella ornithocola]|uniref:Phosphopantetheine adenylyltransferase n=1 Tax=Suttonella ornithocola TaxID=279832 RepID=A0A380MSF2_9GAMM|nr:pantetheine-phosphate adenylyltransferase [Suttonella ornithocola]SUO94833.1 Phosphopantetheine adenylyltransferase [Suttonella ornithocola]
MTKNSHIALYPGTFDPITIGHQDIIERSSKLCDKLYIAVAVGHHKTPLFSFEERVKLVQAVLPSLNLSCEVEVIAYDGLLIDLCHQYQAKMIIRGLRAVSDFEYEFQLAAMNRHLSSEIETIFLTPSENLSFISSTMVREVAKLGGKVDGLVHLKVKESLCEKNCH